MQSLADLSKLTTRFAAATASAKAGASSSTSSAGGSSGASGWIGASLARGMSDITDQIDVRGIELLNADHEKSPARVLFSTDKPAALAGKGKGKATGASSSSDSKADWVESDTDSQLMLFLPFQSTLKIHSLHITSFAQRDEDEEDDDVPARPRKISLHINRTHNLGFEEAEDILATQTIELSDSDWNKETNTAVIETRFVKFQAVRSLVIFVADAEADAEKTRIDRLRIIGESGEKRDMGKLEKIGDEPGE
jgi:hypothetical protein